MRYYFRAMREKKINFFYVPVFVPLKKRVKYVATKIKNISEK